MELCFERMYHFPGVTQHILQYLLLHAMYHSSKRIQHQTINIWKLLLQILPTMILQKTTVIFYNCFYIT